MEYELRNVQEQVARINQQQAAAEAHKNQLIGRASAFEQMLNTWMPGDNGHPEVAAPMPGSQFTRPDVPAPSVNLHMVAPAPSDGGQSVNRIKTIVSPDVQTASR